MESQPQNAELGRYLWRDNNLPHSIIAYSQNKCLRYQNWHFECSFDFPSANNRYE